MCCKKSLFACPVCGNSLMINGKSYKCIDNHSFDAAKSGYVNLLTSDRMNAKTQMITSSWLNPEVIF